MTIAKISPRCILKVLGNLMHLGHLGTWSTTNTYPTWAFMTLKALGHFSRLGI